MRQKTVWALMAFCVSCAALSRQEKSADQVAAERAMIGKKTALLERENQVLREENLELTRSMELQKADFEKKEAGFHADLEKRLAQIKTAEASIQNLTDKMKILESESDGRIKQLVQLNAELSEKHTKAMERLQEDLKQAQVKAARQIEELNRTAAEKQFAQNKEAQEFRARLSEKEKEIEDLRKSNGELRSELNALRPKTPATP